MPGIRILCQAHINSEFSGCICDLIVMSFQICVNWFDFYDPESGVSKYMVGVGTKPGLANIVRLTQQSSKQHSTCFMLDDGNKLEHGKLYYGVVRAFNGAIFQRSSRAISDGGKLILICSHRTDLYTRNSFKIVIKVSLSTFYGVWFIVSPFSICQIVYQRNQNFMVNY